MENAVRYHVVLSDRPEFTIGHVLKRHNDLVKSERDKIMAQPVPTGCRWIVVGWSNPSAPHNWIDA